MNKEIVPIKILQNGKELPLPFYATPLSAGMDLYAAISEPIVLEKGKTKVIPTGISIALPAGLEAQIRSRSGLSSKNGVIVLNAPGTIDADYRGEIGVILHNLGEQDFTITRGMKIAQMVVAPVVQISWQETENLSETQRGTGGFGSTGV
ncbi:MAG: dUTP diphosphatase [Alphaproteobacteria bacterium]|nr:dUTP diphosphatase [Alphaproteobacteria bacterium]